MISAINNRRSIRRFLQTPIAKEDIMDIIQSGTKAPSAKNRQPWKYIIVQEKAKDEMIEIFRQGIAREENKTALLPQSKKHISAAKYTVDIITKAPVVIFAVNTLSKDLFTALTPEEHIYEICNIQSVAASIQNMLLTATEKGIGTLWICDIYFAYEELSKWLNTEGQLIAAIALGYPDEFPKERPRKKIEEIIEWKN
ncbi:nitroreductase family protein [Ructibacterium gallinarum]|uniref:Nitroreductase family protein n=1 Tax=Ructibacterium gallinarum TaxID=2779355 RepID=A0A9D5LZT7_9FIRM|nr:nitroreductase family protein [Ructibacterium gallinarum]MBE5040012.1 nitroreductase family protein [Ructibacterium gallinarum]